MRQKVDRQTTVVKDYSIFNPRDYLNEYYRKVGNENAGLLKFFSEAYALVFRKLSKAKMLELGGGPCIYQLISLAKYPTTIYFSEYLESNRKELKLWLKNDPKAFNWDVFFRFVLGIEGKKITRETIAKRKTLLKKKIKEVFSCDLTKSPPLPSGFNQPYDIVSAIFVSEAISQRLVQWKKIVKRIVNLTKKDGYLSLVTIIGAKYYMVGKRDFVATHLTKKLVTEELGVNGLSVQKARFVEAEHKDQGYDGIFMVLAKKT